jgi:hypothetical protein
MRACPLGCLALIGTSHAVHSNSNKQQQMTADKATTVTYTRKGITPLCRVNTKVE